MTAGSASKVAVEIAVTAWRASFAKSGPPIVTARSGNVIGGWGLVAIVVLVARLMAGQ